MSVKKTKVKPKAALKHATVKRATVKRAPSKARMASAKKAAKKPASRRALTHAPKHRAAKLAKAVAKIAPKAVAAKPVAKAAPPANAPLKAAAVRPATPAPVKGPKAKPEPPPIDHAARIGPLYLGAGHGHLARAVDKSWTDAIVRYRERVNEAIAYESKRSAIARAQMVLNFGRQLQALMNNLATRVQAIVAEAQNGAVADSVRDSARHGGFVLTAELKKLNDSFGAMAGPEGIAPLGGESLPVGMQAQLEQLQRSFFNNIARWADLERALQ